MNAILAFIPILLTIVLMAGFNWGAKKALPLSWLLAVLIALFYWKIDLLNVTAYSFFGVLKALDILIIIFGAILILNTLKISGAMSAINRVLAMRGSPYTNLRLMNVSDSFVADL